MGMAGLSEDFITLTQLNCVQQCSALMANPKPRNYVTAAALFGIYCGVLIYRSYRSYQAKMEARAATEAVRLREEVAVVEDYILDTPVTEQSDYPVTPIAPTTVEPATLGQQANDEQPTLTAGP